MKKYKAKILLVEDDPNLSLVLVDYLEMLTYETLLCKDGVHGFNTFKSTHFDLCILDVMMPKKDGFSLAEGEFTLLGVITCAVSIDLF